MYTHLTTRKPEETNDEIPKLVENNIKVTISKHIEKAISRSGPFTCRKRGVLSGIADTFMAIFRGLFFKNVFRYHSIGCSTICVQNNPKNKTLVIAPPIHGNQNSVNVKPLVSMAISKEWNVVVHNRPKHKYYDESSLLDCIYETKLYFPGTEISVIGLSIGAYEVCKSCISVPVVCISNGYDFTKANENFPWIVRQYVKFRFGSLLQQNLPPCTNDLLLTKSPTLIINAANDPLIPRECLNIGYDIANKNNNVACITTPRGGHLGFENKNGVRWAYEIALEFLESVIS